MKKILNLIIEATFLAYKKPAMKLEGQKRATAIYRQRGKNCGRLLICQRHSVASIKSVDHKLVGLSFGLPGALCETAATPPVWSRAGRPPNENHQWRRATSSCHSFRPKEFLDPWAKKMPKKEFESPGPKFLASELFQLSERFFVQSKV